MKLREIARLCGASEMLSPELAEREPAGFRIDSRAVQPGDLFLAVPGERVDGHQFVREALAQGACAAIVVHHRLPFATALGDDATRLIFVENTICALQQLAARVLAKWGGPVVGITGSAGKTTMKDLTAHLLGGQGRVLKSLGNLNTGYGLGLTVARMVCAGSRPEEFDLAVLEMGMSSYGEIARLTDLAPPTVGVVGNVGVAHLEFFGSPAGIARAKAEMVDGIKAGGTAVLNADDPLVIEMRRRRSDIDCLTFAIEAAADVTASELRSEADLSGTRLRLRTPRGAALVKLPLIGRHNVYNALAAATAAQALGMTADQIGERLVTAAPTPMRGEIVRFPNGVTLIDDSYNSNPPALLEAVRAMRDAEGWPRRVVVAGEMLELGDQAGELHRHCGREIAAAGIDRLIGVRGLARQLVDGAREVAGFSHDRAAFAANSDEAAEMLIEETRPGDLILIKGSRGVRMEKIVERLKSSFDSL